MSSGRACSGHCQGSWSLPCSDHEPWQCPEHALPEDTIGGRAQRYEAIKAERDRYRQTLEVVLALAEEPDEWDNIARTVRAALEEE